MTDATLLPFDLPAVERKKLTVDFDGGNQSSDAGLLLLREAERKLGVCQRIAEAMPDHRDPVSGAARDVRDSLRPALWPLPVVTRMATISTGSGTIR